MLYQVVVVASVGEQQHLRPAHEVLERLVEGFSAVVEPVAVVELAQFKLQAAD